MSLLAISGKLESGRNAAISNTRKVAAAITTVVNNAEVGGVRRIRRFQPPPPSIIIKSKNFDSVFNRLEVRHKILAVLIENIVL